MRALQSLLQALFLRAEGLFNAAFGDRLNPLYRLGEITFFLFWVVAVSGLYLYAFFETGVGAAHASVEAITHRQWFAGGVLRSLHRYASDAMVLTMLLHLLRHFAFDRFRGYRWFSWITGVVLVWLVYASGINGYMLPWDRLAQYASVAVFEWLDALPIFGGALMRNFLYPASVTDRFFSLLSFLHIGLPLFVLLLMWVHVQRVPKARTAPPRPVAAGLLVALLLLSLLQPALSQGGPADLRQAVAAVDLDWFYLALLPLMVAWPLPQVWALAGAGTALLAILPWLPRGRRGREAEHQVIVQGSAGAEAQLRVRAGETLLDAGLREGLALPYECRNGACGLCRCTIAQGTVSHRPYQPSALPDALRAQGQALLCCAVPQEDLVIEVHAPLQPAQVPPPVVHTGRIDAMEKLAPDVMRLWVALPWGERLAFSAGQYIHILLDDGQRRAFSFASPPGGSERIELHVRRIPGGRFTGHVFDGMRVGDPLRFEGPLGRFTLREGQAPLLFVAGATGFAPVKSILEDAFARGLHRPLHLYWGVRRPQDLYLQDLVQGWAREHANFRYVPVVSEPLPDDHWPGRTGLVHEAMLADFPQLAGHEVYVCGSVRMVDSAVRDFLARGLDEQSCFSDAFVPAAQPA
ncbi:cytochrome b N-terminal domain-containing protein [Ramlibacter cellulosilyticus]|nr:cytochrome b N-terminal domain-containing protein [Ramlibacter cellulosilyticus]